LHLAARRLVAAVVLREEGRDQRVLLVTDDGAERPVQIERPRRLALPLAVAGLYERRGDEGQLPSVRAGDRPERLLERVDAQISAVGGRDHERRGGPEDEAEDAAGDARERVRGKRPLDPKAPPLLGGEEDARPRDVPVDALGRRAVRLAPAAVGLLGPDDW